MQPVRLIQVPYDSGWRDQRMGRGPGRLVEMGAAESLRRTVGSVEQLKATRRSLWQSWQRTRRKP